MHPRYSGRHLVLISGIAGVVIAVAAPEQLATVLWQHFVGPVVADAANQQTAVWNGVPAHPGYTAVSILVYASILLAALPAIRRVAAAVDRRFSPELVISLTPLIVFGGLLRAVEDAGIVPFPWNIVLVSPLIYVAMTAVGAATLFAADTAAKRSPATGFHTALRGIGGGAAVLAAAVLAVTHTARIQASIIPLLLGIPAAAIIAGIAVQRLVSRRWRGTLLRSRAGTVAVASQVFDGAVTAVVVSVLGGSEKLPLSAAIIDTVHPAAFPAVKLGVALGFLGLVERDEWDLWTALMLLTLIAVGLGPGTRNLARAVFGV